MPRIGLFGPPIRIKYKLELDHVIRVPVNKHVFVEIKFTYLRVTSICSQYSSCKLKTRQDKRQGIRLPLEAIAFYSDSFLALKIYVEQKVAENWAPYCTSKVVHLYYNTLAGYMSYFYRVDI